jgi:hypothetical protein
MPETIEQRVAWLEKVNSLVTKDEFKIGMASVDIKINSLEGSLIARIASIKWILTIGVGLILGAQDSIQALIKRIFGF